MSSALVHRNPFFDGSHGAVVVGPGRNVDDLPSDAS
jgi:hypothetical protein